MMQKYSALMVENEFTMRIADINARIAFLLSAADDRTEKSAKLFLERIVNGEMGVITDSAFLESLKVNNAGTENSIRMTDLIEYQQYLKAAWFNDLGLNANYNMKRESISPNEAQLNDAALLPLVDDMLESREKALKEINEKYGLDIKVKLDSSWMNEQNKQLFVQDPEVGTEDPQPSDHTPQSDPEETPDPVPLNDEPTEDIQEPSEDLQEIKEDLQEIKEDIEEIKEETEVDENDGDPETE
jgi:hypothetical protein